MPEVEKELILKLIPKDEDDSRDIILEVKNFHHKKINTYLNRSGLELVERKVPYLLMNYFKCTKNTQNCKIGKLKLIIFLS